MNERLIGVLHCLLWIALFMNSVCGQDRASKPIIKDILNKSSLLEFGITPRAAGQADRKISHLDSNHFSFKEGIIRLQLGLRFMGNDYFHLCYDYFFRRLSDDFPFEGYADYDGSGISMQYNYKWRSSSDLRKFSLWGKRIHYGIIPETFISCGLTNMRSGFDYSSVRASDKWFPYWSVGTGFAFRPSRYFELTLIYQLEYYPSIKSYPFRNIPQFKFNFRL